jgi:hypothetical protein
MRLRGQSPRPKAPRSAADVTRLLAVPSEDEECQWLIQWAEVTRFNGWKLSEVLVCVPNGAYHGADRRAGAVVARKLREKGLKPGVFDYVLPVPLWHKHCPGLWLEMKRTRGGVVSDDQEKFRSRMLQLGWRCEIAKGWVAAQAVILDHLQEWGKHEREKPGARG